MIDKFECGKKYIFDKEIALQDNHLKANYESGNATYWVDDCDGRKVIDIGRDGEFGFVEMYTIKPMWCKEI
jgi:hypothetical protein